MLLAEYAGLLLTTSTVNPVFVAALEGAATVNPTAAIVVAVNVTIAVLTEVLSLRVVFIRQSQP